MALTAEDEKIAQEIAQRIVESQEGTIGQICSTRADLQVGGLTLTKADSESFVQFKASRRTVLDEIVAGHVEKIPEHQKERVKELVENYIDVKTQCEVVFQKIYKDETVGKYVKAALEYKRESSEENLAVMEEARSVVHEKALSYLSPAYAKDESVRTKTDKMVDLMLDSNVANAEREGSPVKLEEEPKEKGPTAANKLPEVRDSELRAYTAER